MKRKYSFYIGLNDNHTAKTQELVEVEFKGTETEKEINEILEEEYQLWLNENAELTYWEEDDK